MKFDKVFFNPDADAGSARMPKANSGARDRRDGSIYAYTGDIILLVNAALATGRPLLIEGPPGSGKSSLAPSIARKLGWWYLEQVITSRTTARDLLWEFDSLRRLHDAQVREKTLPPKPAYVTPGVLWWAFDPVGASKRGMEGSQEKPLPNPGRSTGKKPKNAAVVLLDEIDKAEPDVPNDLLVPLGSGQFTVDETGVLVRAQRPLLLVVTTNGERDLPPAFIRRCVRMKLEAHTQAQLVDIAMRHHGAEGSRLYQRLAEWLVQEREAARERGIREPSTAEFLDAIQACKDLKLDIETQDDLKSEDWQKLSRAVLLKVDPPELGEA
ncbi:AAA family ATPase [Pyxidicoccus trucidator]|uniref:AAA family ATPase n=1 Tax=Pyxidicoccus trucidator TaxID=2709662 RepID=UPI0013DB9EF8|nr:MoxR family ATPase [Pyxidicoccus trucidator]